MTRSIDDLADINGKYAKVQADAQRAFLQPTPSPAPQLKPESLALKHSNEIPDLEGAETGLCGSKAPASPRQTGDIEDRLRAAGKLRDTIPFVVK